MRDDAASDARGAGKALTVIRPGALGDALLALPALAWLSHMMSPRVILITRADVLGLVTASGLAETVWPWDLPDWGALYDPTVTRERMTERARAALVDAGEVMAWLPDSDGVLVTTLRRLATGRVHVAPPRPEEAPGEPVEHVALWLARSLASHGPTSPGGPQDLAGLWRALGPLRWPAVDGRAAEAVLRASAGHAVRVIALHPGSGGAAKRWPPEQFAALSALARASGYSPLMIAGPADAETIAAVQSAVSALDGEPLSVTRDLTVGALAALLSRCVGYVGNDSGVSHLAGLVGIPTVAIFGPTEPARWAPVGPRVTAITAPNGDLRRQAPEIVWSALVAAADAG